MFALAQVNYARAFGFRPFNPYAGAVFTALGLVIYSYLSPGRVCDSVWWRRVLGRQGGWGERCVKEVVDFLLSVDMCSEFAVSVFCV